MCSESAAAVVAGQSIRALTALIWRLLGRALVRKVLPNYDFGQFGDNFPRNLAHYIGGHFANHPFDDTVEKLIWDPRKVRLDLPTHSRRALAPQIRYFRDLTPG